jgi:hypothetical protein
MVSALLRLISLSGLFLLYQEWEPPGSAGCSRCLTYEEVHFGLLV